MTPRNFSLNPTPELHFTVHDFDRWSRDGVSLNDLEAALDDMRRRVGVAADYRWANSNDYIDNVFGRPVLKFSFHGGTLDLWLAGAGGRHVGTYDAIPPYRDLQKIISNVTEGMVRCYVCGEWFGEGEWVPFSFAGAVCKADYDPARHKPPDTRGD